MRESRDQQYTSSQTLERLLNEAIIHGASSEVRELQITPRRFESVSLE